MIQLTIMIDDKVGKLASILEVFTNEGINIHGISTERGPVSEIRLIVEHPKETKSKLEEAGFVVYETNVMGVTLSDTPGELAKITKIFSTNKISIEYIYRYGSDDGSAKLVIHTNDDLDHAKGLLQEFKVE